MKRVTCLNCGRTLQDGESNVDIGDYTICPKCYKMFKTLFDHFSKEKPNVKSKSEPKTTVKKKTTSKKEDNL